MFAISGWQFTISLPAQAAGDHVRINEIAWMGTATSANDEWIELYNPTDADVVLDGWRLAAADGQPDIALAGTIAAGGYFLLERTDDETVPGITADLIYTGSLGNTGETLALFAADGTTLDSLIAGAEWPGGDNVSKQTLAFIAEAWTTSAEAGGTPGRANSEEAVIVEENGNEEEEVEEEAPEDPEENNPNSPTEVPSSGSSGGAPSYRWGDVVINEFVADPADGEVEWIELCNLTGDNLALADWSVYDGGGSKTVVNGTLAARGYYVIEKPKGALNNAGDVIELRWNDAVIDRVVYGNQAVDGGNAAANAPAATDPYSVARKGDGLNTFNNKNDFAVTMQVTKGAANIILDPSTAAETALPPGVTYDYATDIRITELFPNPFGPDDDNEFIELYNAGSRTADLTGWALSDDGARKYIFKAGTGSSWQLPAGGYLALQRTATGIALNNTVDSVRLWQPLKETPLQTVDYAAVEEGMSYAYATSTQAWAWSETVTPGTANSIAEKQLPPIPDFSYSGELRVGQIVQFDSSDTHDRNDDELAFYWQFGTAATSTDRHPLFIFREPGAQAVTLTVSDGIHEVKKKKTLMIEAVEVAAVPLAPAARVAATEGEGWGVRVSELLPDPAGDDADGEWIELYNAGSAAADLSGWQLDDGVGGSKPYAINGVIVPSGGYRVFPRPDTGLALNNSNDGARLLAPDGKAVSEIAYGTVTAGAAYASVNGKWQWTLAATPGEANVLQAPPVKATAKRGGSTKRSVKPTSAAATTTLASIKNIDTGDSISVVGTVAVLPGVLSSQYFYVVGETERGGVQVYNYKKDFPALKVGDVLMVTGEISEVNGEKRIKTKTANDMQLTAISVAPQPVAVTTETIGSELEAQLLSITGEVVDRKGSTVWVDDGAGELEVYVKQSTGIDKGLFTEGETVTVAGLYLRGGNGFRLYPRSNEDISVVKGVSAEAEGMVLGAVSTADEWELEPRGSREELLLYFVIISVVANAGLAAVIWRRHRT